MAGAAKNRQQKERKAQAEEAKKSSSDNWTSPTSSQRSGTPPERLGPPSRYDGNRDPEARPRGASTASVDSDAQATPAEGTLSGSVVERNSLYTIPKNLDVGAFASWQANGVSSFLSLHAPRKFHVAWLVKLFQSDRNRTMLSHSSVDDDDSQHHRYLNIFIITFLHYCFMNISAWSNICVQSLDSIHFKVYIKAFDSLMSLVLLTLIQSSTSSFNQFLHILSAP